MEAGTETGTPERPTLTVNQAAERCQVSRRTIYNWLSQGKLRTWRTAGGHLRIVEESLWRREWKL